MGILKAIITGVKKNITKSKESGKQPSTKYAEQDYDLSLDICQKVLFLLCILPFLTFPWKLMWNFLIMWPICCSIVGFCLFYFPFKKIFKKKSQELKKKKDAKRFLCLPSRIWSWIVALFLLVVFVADIFIGSFEVLSLVGYFFQFICIHAILTKKVSLAYNRYEGAHDPNKRGTKEWVEANGLERVYGVGGDIIYRDKNGNYYDNNTGSYLPIPEPITIRNKK